MIKKFLALLQTVSLLLTLCPAYQVGAADVRQTVEAAYGTPVVDGEVDDVWNSTNYTVVDYNRMTGNKKYKGWFKVLWDEERIYILSKVYCDGYNNTASVHEQDSVDIYIDEDMRRGSTFDGNDYQLRVGWDDGKITGNAGTSSFDFQNMKAKSKVVDGGFYIETSFPFTTIKPYEGLKTGFEIQMNEGSILGSDFTAYTWNCREGWVWNKPDCYGTLELKKSVGVTRFNEPEWTGTEMKPGYKKISTFALTPEVEYVSDVNVSFDSNSYTLDILHVNEYPELALSDLIKIMGATGTDNSFTKDGKTLTFTEGSRLAEDADGHFMLEVEPVMYDGKLYVPATCVESYLAYQVEYNRFGKVMKISTGTDYPDAEVFIYAKDYGTVGDGVHDDGPALLRAIDAAINCGKPAKVILEKGKYLMGPRQDNYGVIILNGVNNIEIDGQGSEILLSPVNSFIDIDNCANIKIRNLDVDYQELLFTQGTIKSVDVDNVSWIMTIQEGYPLPATNNKWVNYFYGDGRTGGWWFGQLMDKNAQRLKFTAHDHYFVNSVEKVEGTERDYKITMRADQKVKMPYAEVGDRFVINTRCSAYDVGDSTTYGDDSTIAVDKSGDILFENVNIYGSKHLGAILRLNWGRIRFYNYGMKTKGDRLLAANSDGIHCVSNRAGIVLDGCTLMNNLDDHINTKAADVEIKSIVDDYTYTASNGERALQVGDELLFYYPEGKAIIGRAFIKRVTYSGGTYTFSVDRKIEGVNPSGGTGYCTSVYNVNACTRGSVIRNSEFMYSRRHALITRSPNSVFENNDVIECGGAAVMAGNEHDGTGGGEGPFPSSFTMRNNYITAPGITSGYYPIEIRCQGAGLGQPYCIDGFLAENNDINVDTGNSTIWAFSVENLYLLNNKITSKKKLNDDVKPVLIQNSHIANIDGLTLDYENQPVNNVITMVGCDVDMNNITNVKSMHNNDGLINNFAPVN